MSSSKIKTSKRGATTGKTGAIKKADSSVHSTKAGAIREARRQGVSKRAAGGSPSLAAPPTIRHATDVYEGRPLAVDVGIGRERFYVTLADGQVLSVPYDAYDRLASGTAAERQDWSLIGRGGGIHWEQLDEDVSVGGLVREYGAGA